MADYLKKFLIGMYFLKFLFNFLYVAILFTVGI